VVGMTLVDRKGRKFLFLLGTSGIIVSLSLVGMLFLHTEKNRYDVASAIQAMVGPTNGHTIGITDSQAPGNDQSLSLRFDPAEAKQLAAATGLRDYASLGRLSLSIIYSYGGFTAATPTARSDDAGASPLQIDRNSCVPSSKVEAFFRNPFIDLDAARTAPLRIEHAYIVPVPDALNGWLVALGLYTFAAFFALGPGVCVWLALSELMPTRIRSNGMSIALVINQIVATTLAAIFLPVVGRYGYSTMFFLFVAFTVIYLLTVALFLPETKGKTLEEIEAHFEAE